MYFLLKTRLKMMTSTTATTAVLKEDKLYQIDLHGEMDLTREALQSIRGKLYSGHHSINHPFMLTLCSYHLMFRFKITLKMLP